MSARAPEVLNLRMGPRRCSNRCAFCFDRSLEAEPMPDAARAGEVLERAAARTRSVVFTGTEPTLNPALEQAVARARALGYSFVGLVTNGRRLADAAYCARLAAAGLTEVRVSLHGPTAAAHDALTGRPGSFRQALAGLRNAARARGRGLRVEVNCVVVKRNLGLMRPMRRLAAPLCDRLNFNVVEPVGSADDRFEEVAPRYSEILRAAHDSELDFRSPSLCLSRIPDCAGGYDWSQETWLLSEGEGLSAFDPARGKTQGPPCRGCARARRCPGVWERYVRAYGWEEFVPVAGPAAAGGRALVLGPGDCVSSELRRGFLRGHRALELAWGSAAVPARLEGWVREARGLGYASVEVSARVDPAAASARATLGVLARARRAGAALRVARI